MLRAMSFQLLQPDLKSQSLLRLYKQYNTAKLFLSQRFPLIMAQVTFKVPLMKDLMNTSSTNQLQLQQRYNFLT